MVSVKHWLPQHWLPHYTLSSSKVHLVPKSVTDSVEVTSHATLNWFQNAKKRIGNLEVGVAISKKRIAQYNLYLFWIMSF